MTLLEKLRNPEYVGNLPTLKTEFTVDVMAEAAGTIDCLLAALKEAERYLEYLGGESAGSFVGPGMPADALAQTRTAIARGMA